MTSLLQNDHKFIWTEECEVAFYTLRNLLTTAPVLAQPDIEKPFDVFCDASKNGLGCVLMQDGRVIAYASCGDTTCLGICAISLQIIRVSSTYLLSLS